MPALVKSFQYLNDHGCVPHAMILLEGNNFDSDDEEELAGAIGSHGNLCFEWDD